MTVTDDERYQLQTGLRTALGDDVTTILIKHLPPAGWGDVATVHDVANLETRVDARFNEFETRVDARFNEFETRVDARFNEFDIRINGRIDKLEERIDGLDDKMTAQFESLRHEIVVLRGSMHTALIVGSGILIALIAGMLQLAVYMVQSR